MRAAWALLTVLMAGASAPTRACSCVAPPAIDAPAALARLHREGAELLQARVLKIQALPAQGQLSARILAHGHARVIRTADAAEACGVALSPGESLDLIVNAQGRIDRCTQLWLQAIAGLRQAAANAKP